MALGEISEMGYIAMRTRDFDTSVEIATEVLGLKSTAVDNKRAYLAASNKHHELVYINSDEDGIDHIGLKVENEESLQVVRAKLRQAGYVIHTDLPLEAAIDHGFAFTGPEGYVFHIFADMQHAPHQRLSYGPDRYGHINIHPQDPTRMKDFFVDLLGFKVSDIVGTDFAYFLRCNVDHHGIALIKGKGTLHHHAWQTQGIADLGRLGDRLFSLGRRLIWGPIRHGAGHNMAAYYVEPNGTVVELYTDLEQIWDEHRPPVEWDPEDRTWFNRWGVYRGEEFRSHGARPLEFGK